MVTMRKTAMTNKKKYHRLMEFDDLDTIQIRSLLAFRTSVHHKELYNKRHKLYRAKVCGEWFIQDNGKHTFTTIGNLRSSLNYAFSHMCEDEDAYRQFLNDWVEYFEVEMEET